MVQGTIPLHKLIQYSLAIEAVKEDGDWLVYYYPNESTQLKILLDSSSIQLLKQKRDQMLSFLNQEVTLSGEIVERQELETVTYPSRTVEEWVLK